MRHEWKCGCGAWLPMGLFKHVHIEGRAPTLAQLIDARAAGVDISGDSKVVTYERWTPEHERRQVPDEQ